MARISVLLLLALPFLSVSAHFELVPGWPDPSIAAKPVYGSGLTLDADRNLLVLHRGGIMIPGYPANTTIPEDVLLVVDAASGKVLRSWGRDMFYWPHGIEITPSGDIFITDSRLHQVFKFAYNSSTKLWNTPPILTLGERFISGTDQTHFCTPADVAVSGDGSFYVADGYCNSRILKFDRDGRFLLQFSAGSNPLLPPTPFNITHGVTIAPTASGNDFLVFVADRDNSRIQAFSSNGTFLYEITGKDLNPLTANSMMFSVAHVPNADYDYGVIYGVNGYLPWGEAEVFEIGVGVRNSSLITSFRTTPGGEGPGSYEAPHDIIASKDGKLIYVVISVADSLILRKYMLHEHGSGDGVRIRFAWGSIMGMLVVHFMLRFK